MRRVWPLLLGAGLALGQGEPAPAKWTVARPAAAPTGEPVTLRWAFEPGWAHKLELAIRSDGETSLLGRLQVDLALRFRLEVHERAEDGTARYVMPFEFARLELNGADALPTLAGELEDPKIEGWIQPTGEPVEGTMQVEGMGQPLGDPLGGLLPPLPRKAVRRGAVWETPVAQFARRLGALRDDATEGAVYHRLESVADGVAVIRTVFGFTVAGDHLQVQGLAGKGVIRMKGETVLRVGLDGYLKESVTTAETEASLEGTTPIEIRSRDTTTLKGGREKFDLGAEEK